MKQISSRDFQKSYAKLDEPYEVTAWGESIGVWVPRASALFESIPLDIPDSEKAHPVQVRRTLPNGREAIRTQVRVVDSVQMSRQQGANREPWRISAPILPRRGR